MGSHATRTDTPVSVIPSHAASDTLALVLAELRDLHRKVDALHHGPRLVSLSEAARQLHVSVRSLQRGIAANRYARFGHGRATRVDVEQIRAAMRQGG
jgi:hypothetical protein